MVQMTNLSLEHLHEGVDYVITVLLISGGVFAAAMATGWVRVRASTATLLLRVLAIGLIVAGVDEFAARFVVRQKDPFSLSETLIVLAIIVALFGLLPWLSLRFVKTRKTVESLRGGLESVERTKSLALAEREVLAQQYAESKQELRTTLEEAYRLAKLVETSKDAIIGVTKDGNVWHWNRAAEELFRLSAKEMLGKPLQIVKVGAFGDLWRESLRVLTPPFQTGQDEVDVLCGDGSTVPVWLSVSRTALGTSQRGGYSVIARNVSDKKRVEATISSSLAEKNALLKELHHRVKNNLQLICSLLRLQSKEAVDDQALRLFRKSEDRVRSLALVHDKLYKSERLSSINFGSYLTDLVTQLVRTNNAQGSVTTSFDVQDIFFPVDTAITCGLVINEVVGNSLKHAKSDSPEIKVALAKKGSQITISVWDNGSAPLDRDTVENPKNLGLTLVKTLTNQLKGHISLRHNGGTEFLITLPETILQEPEVAIARHGVAA